jgi:hypothetical protein
LNVTINPNCTSAAIGIFGVIANGNMSYTTFSNDGYRRGLKAAEVGNEPVDTQSPFSRTYKVANGTQHTPVVTTAG